MREVMCAALAGLLLCTVLPAAAAFQCRRNSPEEVRTEPPEKGAVIDSAAETGLEVTMYNTEVFQAGDSFDNNFNLPVLLGDSVDSMTLHDYLVGALVGEMPLKFDIEALKAQAIACRTYALRQYASRKHDPAAVCTISNCCECWKASDGVEEAYRQKAEQAVSETDGIVLTYDGELIEATFFSCSAGQTEAAADVWGSDIPYLQSVSSPGEEQAPHFAGKVTVPIQMFQEKLQEEDNNFTVSDKLSDDSFSLTYTQGGGVKTVQIGGAIFTGKTFRKLFGLDSTDFKITLNGQNVVFSTSGYGHRVGMSQYGAQAMASEGADFETILLHYYTGVALTDCRTFYP